LLFSRVESALVESESGQSIREHRLTFLDLQRRRRLNRRPM
jgi:hypothetical protein